MAQHEQEYDVVVIGAGSGGLTAAVGAAKVGRKTLLIERAHMGGECTNAGCIPSKALLHHAKAYRDARAVSGGSMQSETFRKEAFAYVRKTIKEVLATETVEHFRALGIDVVMGEAEFIDRCALRVDEHTYRYKHAIIATGSRPRTIDVPGLESRQQLTNENLFALPDVPARTLVIGSGPIGMEMGHALALLGSRVTIATIDSEFAKLEDPSIRPILAEQFQQDGVSLLLTAYIDRVEQGEAVFSIKPNGPKGDIAREERVPFDRVLMAIGREPNLPAGLDAAGISYDNRCILVDSQHRTSNKYVYAVGDVAQMLKFTHTADDVARQVITRIASKGWLRVNKHKAVPKVTYTEPEVAQVGLSWEQAKAKYDESELRRVEVPLSEVDRARTDNATGGLLVVIARKLSGQIVGAHYAGPRAGEIIAIFTLAIDQKISLWRLRRTIYAYPTYALIIKKAADAFFAEQIANLKSDVITLAKRQAPRIVAIIFWLSLIIGFQYYRSVNDLTYTDVLFQLIDFFTSTIYGPLIYMLLYALRPLILFPATLLTALSGALFGLWWGIIYTIIGENASANLAYGLGRFFGGGLRLEDSVIGNWVQALRKRPFGSVLFMRLFYVPFDLTNYGSGILKVNWGSYALATVIGIMPGLTTFVALGAGVDLAELQENGVSFDIFNPWFVALSVVIFAVSLGLSKLLKRWKPEM
mgnify:CR=1 FL=1